MSQYPGSAPGSPYSANSAGWSANGYDPAMAGGQPSQYPSTAPFQAPQAGYPEAAGRPTTSKSLAAPTALAAAGLAVLLIAVIGGIGSAVTRSQFNDTIASLPDDEAATVELDKGSTYGLFYSDSGDAPDCSVTSPDGDDVDTKSSSSSTKVKGGKLFTTFSSSESGSYTVDCNNTSGVSVGEIVAPSSAKATLLSLFGVVGAFIIGVLGVGMGAGGMAWRSKLAAAATPAPTTATAMTGAATDAMGGAPGIYTQGAWQSGQPPQGGQYVQQPQYQQPDPVGQQAPYAPSAAGAGAPQYSPQTAPTAQFGWAGQQPQPGQQAQPEQPSVFTQPVQPGQQGQSGQYNPQGQYNQPGGWPAQ